MMSGQDALFAEAVWEKRYEDVEKLFPLVSNSARRVYINGDDFHPLHYAAFKETVAFFVSTGVDVNIKHYETDETPLLTVTKLNKPPEVIRELLNFGASTEARNKYTMNTPLNQSTLIPECPPETIQALLEHGAAVNTANKLCNTPLHNACQNYKGDLKIIELLLKFGSPVNFKNLAGDTPLNVSLQNPACTAELVKLLLNYNSKVDVKAFKDAMKVLHDDYLNIITELAQHSFIASGNQWSDILERVFSSYGSEQKLEECGKLLVKHSFLQCDDPHTSICSLHRGFPDDYLSYFNIFQPYQDDYEHRVRRALSRYPRPHISDDLKYFADNCLAEIKRMKTDMLINDVSLYEFIASRSSKIFLDNKILRILKEDTYPIYSSIILNKIRRAALLDKLVLQQVYTVAQRDDSSRKIMLDTLSVRNIAKYLSIDEIRNLTDAFSNPLKDECCFWDNLLDIEAYLIKKARFQQSARKNKLVTVTGHPSARILRKRKAFFRI